MMAPQSRAGYLTAATPPTMLIHHLCDLEIKAGGFARASRDTRLFHRTELLPAAGLPTAQFVRAMKSRAALHRLMKVLSKAPER